MKTIFEEIGGTYRQDGNYLLPNLELPVQQEQPLGKYGRMRLHYLKEQHHAVYTGLLLAGKLDEHLREVDERAAAQVRRIITAIAKADGTDEALKARDQLRWVGLMDNYRACAEEIVLKAVVMSEDAL